MGWIEASEKFAGGMRCPDIIKSDSKVTDYGNYSSVKKLTTDSEIAQKGDEISGSDYTPVSFVSADNTDIGLVQFAIRTDDIKK